MSLGGSIKIETFVTDVLIIGAGGAGLRAAIELSQAGVACMLISKRSYADAHTRLAAGGINAALANVDTGDSWEVHAVDTILEGHEICSPHAVEILTREAPERVMELAEWGCPFARTDEGKLNQRFFGAQSHPRTCFVGDCTGSAILSTLLSKVREYEIPFHENVFVTKLQVKEGRVCGALGFFRESGQWLQINAREVILAGGGYAGLYRRSSSRHDENTGDAAALALEAGASLRDMEMVQFHPTGMVSPEEMRGVLVSEAVRGEGGKLYNCKGERYMQRYSPDKLELDARDVVARANYREIREGRGTKNGGVLLDISQVDAEYIHQRLPMVYKQFEQYGIDITCAPMEVAPTAHYAMGGVKVDFPYGKSEVQGLYVIGEASSGIHGANRLGGNSLAETLVFGKLTGEHLAQNILENKSPLLQCDQQAMEHFSGLNSWLSGEGQYYPQRLFDELSTILWDCGGIIRSEQDLKEGLERLNDLDEKSSHLKLCGQIASMEVALNLRFGLVVAHTILQSALMREESRGAHYRSDKTDKQNEWKKNIVCRKDGEDIKFSTEEIGALPENIHLAMQDERVIQYHHLE